MTEWWRDAVFYEIYVRSFADSNGDGVGDLPGITARLPYLRELGVDAIWLTPFYPSPEADHGYDVADYVDVDPRFGTLADFDALVARAHELGPAGDRRHRPQPHLDRAPVVPGRVGDRPLRRDVHVPAGRHGGPAEQLAVGVRRPGVDARRASAASGTSTSSRPSSPTSTGTSRRCATTSTPILRFWLDRGVDGFRIDVAHALVKDAALADEPEPFPESRFSSDWRTAIDRPEVHEIYRDWRALTDS